MSKTRIIVAFAAILVVIAAFSGYRRWLQTASLVRLDDVGEQSPVARNNLQPSASHSEPIAAHSSSAESLDQLIPRFPLTNVQAITSESPANQAYDAFVGLKKWLIEDPEAIRRVVEILLDPNDGSSSQKRQRSIMYGALAETRSLAAAEALIEVLKQAHHEDDAIQAAAALGDHVAPPVQALDVLWQLGQRSSSPRQNAAILAYGSVANRLGSAGEHITEQLLSAAGEAQAIDQKIEFLAVMGNHGSPQYLSFLKQSAQDPDEDVRAAAVYGARYHKAEEAGAFVAEIATKDVSNKVKAEALRALMMQLDQRRDFIRVANVAMSTSKEEVQIEAARVLKAAFERSHDAEAQLALEQILKSTKSENVRAFINQNGT